MLRQEEGRIKGVVAGESDTPFARASIETEGRPRQVLQLDDFVLETETGPVEVTLDTLTALLPEREISGDFGELLDDPLTGLVMDHAPGDHVHAKISGNVVKRGDEIVIHGCIEHSPNADGGYREAPTQRVNSITAHVIAMGEDAESLLDHWLEEQRKKTQKEQATTEKRREGTKKKPSKKPSKDPLAPAPRPLFLMWLFALITVALMVHATDLGLPTVYDQNNSRFTGANVFWLLATSCLGGTGFIWRRRRWMPDFHTVNKAGSGKGVRWSVGKQISLGTILLLFTSFVTLTFGPYVSSFAVAALCLYMPIIVLKNDQKNANMALALLRAKPLSPELPDKRFGRIEGEFEGALDYKRNHTTHSSTDTVTRTDSNGNHYQAQETTTWVTWTEDCGGSKDARLLPQGSEPIELALRDANWAASDYVISYSLKKGGGLGEFLKHMPKKHANRIRNAQRRSQPSLERHAANGFSILAAARIRRGSDGSAAFQVTGPGSFLLFTAPPGTSARSALIGHLAAHYVGLAMVVSSVALPLYFALSW